MYEIPYIYLLKHKSQRKVPKTKVHHRRPFHLPPIVILRQCPKAWPGVLFVHGTLLATHPPRPLQALKPRITLALHLTCCSTPTLDTLPMAVLQGWLIKESEWLVSRCLISPHTTTTPPYSPVFSSLRTGHTRTESRATSFTPSFLFLSVSQAWN